MTAAFILAINLFVAAVFAVAFGVIAATNPASRGAKWLACGYAVGITNVVLEYILPFQANPLPAAVAIFLVFLLALSLCTIGVARHYGVKPPWRAMGAVAAVSILAVPWIFTMPYASPLRNALYQSPYFIIHMLAMGTVVRSGRRQALDLMLIGALGLAGSIYLAKPIIAMVVGMAESPQGYMATQYAAISQSLGSGTLIAVALILLLAIMRDTTAEILARSETDPLSSVLNRRGFEYHAVAALEQGDAVLVVADLDYFKQINDNFGHAAGDGVIAHFAAILRDAAPEGAIVGRIGGEEFAVLLPDAMLSDGRIYAERARERIAAKQLPILGVDRRCTASFGVAQKAADDSLADLSRRADAALYRAKAGGRNLVRVGLGEMSAATDAA